LQPLWPISPDAVEPFGVEPARLLPTASARRTLPKRRREGHLSGERVERRLAAILAADVAGYSRLMGQDEAGTLARLKALRRELIDPKIAEHKGRIVKTTGDGILTEFPSVVEAVACALAVQEGMATRNTAVPKDQRIEFRIGINSGDVIVEDGDIHGDGVNIAARLEALAEPGAICVSAIVQSQVEGRLDCAFEDQGEQSLKNIAGPVRVYRVRSGASGPESPHPNPPPHAGVGSAHSARVGAAEPLALPDKPSIAVLPFQNMSGDPEQEYFADGMVEEIITALSRIRWLFVIARNSSFTYKGQAVNVKRVGHDLGVRYILEGSVRRGGNRVRVTAQLIDAISGAHVWAERYDRDLSDIFAVQDEITASVAGVIEPALAEAEQQRVLHKPPDRLDAWEAYQRGLWHFNKYGAEDNKIAQTFFRQAIALDPNFAPGHYGYALALLWDFWLYSTVAFKDINETILEEARLAVSLDDKDAMAHAVLAGPMNFLGEWETAVAEARAALALNPNNAFAMGTLGRALTGSGYYDEAIDQSRRALRASPHDPLTWAWTAFLGHAQFCSRDFAAALDTLRQVIRMRPRHTFALEYIAASLAHLGRLDEAREALKRVRAQVPEQLQRYRQRPPFRRPDDWALLTEGLRLAAGETA
jgi:adenylate cyclase